MQIANAERRTPQLQSTAAPTDQRENAVNWSFAGSRTGLMNRLGPVGPWQEKAHAQTSKGFILLKQDPPTIGIDEVTHDRKPET